MPDSELANRKGEVHLPTDVRMDFACHEYMMRLLAIDEVIMQSGDEEVIQEEADVAWMQVITNWTIEAIEDQIGFSHKVRALWDLHYQEVFSQKYLNR